MMRSPCVAGWLGVSWLLHHQSLLLWLCLLLRTTTTVQAQENYTFALIGKQLLNPFFQVAYSGCEDKANSITAAEPDTTVRCEYHGTELEDATEQAKIVDDLIAEGNVDGISLSIIDPVIAAVAIQKAMDAGIPVVTFDSDAPDSTRMAYMGTDNWKFGIELGKVLDQLSPEGGKYGVIAAEATNVLLRAQGVTQRLDEDSEWIEVADSPRSCEDRTDRALEVMWEFAQDPEIGAIISVGGWPMWDEQGWREFVDANRHIQLICGDSLQVQIELINRGYANALVGQLPYNMGELSVETLLEIKRGTFDPENSVIYGTAFLEILQFPLDLPEVNVDDNTLDHLVLLGYFYFGIIVLLILFFSGWTWWHRKNRVIVASQPYFLYMITFGTLILSSTIIPLTFDDEQYGEEANDKACMSVPWLASLGFTTTFAALFAKLWRVNRIFHNPNKFKRVVVKPKDVLLPYLALMGANLVVLITWTIVSPLRYDREHHEGTDPWNRVISTYGTCHSDDDHSELFLVAIGFINFGVLFIANFQAYQARHVTTEFSESKYIAIIMASLLQCLVVGVPVVFLVRDQPRTYFVVLSTVIFMTCAAVLLVMFVPKIHYLNKAVKRKRTHRDNGSPAESTYSEAQEGLRVRIGKAAPSSFLEGHHRVTVTGLTTSGAKYQSSASNEDSCLDAFEPEEDDDDNLSGPLSREMMPITETMDTSNNNIEGEDPQQEQQQTMEFLTARDSDLSGGLVPQSDPSTTDTAEASPPPPEARPATPPSSSPNQDDQSHNGIDDDTSNYVIPHSQSGSAHRLSNPESCEELRISNFEDERTLTVETE